MWLSGLRGAMAYALAMESSHNQIFNNPAIGKLSGDVMLVITILYSIFTILGVSSFLYPIMVACGVTNDSKKDDDEIDRSESEQVLIDNIEMKKEVNCCMKLKNKI
jgi:NhaP-type Na+/H+ or K+/H+ antiporter